MTRNSFKRYFIGFFVFVVLHVILIRYFVLLDFVSCLSYIGFFILIPLAESTVITLFVAFFVGFFIDLFYDSIGINAFASVSLMYFRQNIISSVAPLSGFDKNLEISPFSVGSGIFVLVVFSTTIFHHFLVFFLEAFNVNFLLYSFGKIIASSLYTTFMILSLYFIFLNQKK